MGYEPLDRNKLVNDIDALPIRPESKAGMIFDALMRDLDDVNKHLPELKRLAWIAVRAFYYVIASLVAALLLPFMRNLLWENIVSIPLALCFFWNLGRAIVYGIRAGSLAIKLRTNL